MCRSLLILSGFLSGWLWVTIDAPLTLLGQPGPEREGEADPTPVNTAQDRARESAQPDEASKEEPSEGDRLTQSQELTNSLKIWIPFQQWSELKRLRDRVVNSRQADPSYQGRQRSFQELLAQRTQWEVNVPEVREGAGIEPLRAQLKLIEDAKKANASRRSQGLEEHISGLEIYLSQLLDQERVSLELIEELLSQQALNELEGPPTEEVDELDLKSLSERHERLTKLERIVATELSEVEAWRAQLSELTKALEVEGAEYERRQEELDQRSTLVTELLSQHLLRRELEGEIEDLSLETLIGLRATKVDEDQQAKALLDERLESLMKLKGLYDERHRAKLQALKPPVLPSPPSGEGEDSFLTAARLQYSVETSERFMRFHKRRLEATQQALEAHDEYLKELDEALTAREVSFKATLAHDVIEARIRSLSEPVFWSHEELVRYAQNSPTVSALSALNQLRERWQADRALTAEEAERWRATLREDQEAIERHQGELEGEGGLRERLKQELIWLNFLKEIDSYDTPKLLSTYQADVLQLSALEQKVETLEASYEHLSIKLRDAVALRDRLSDPLMRQYPASDLEFKRWAAPLYALLEPKGSTPSGSIESDETPNEPQSVSLPDQVGALTDALRARIPPRVNYYQERQQLTSQVNQLLVERSELITQLASLFNQRGERARQIWRSATLLKRRHAQQQSFELTTAMKKHRSLTWVNTLKVTNISGLREEHEREERWLTYEPNYAPIKSSLEEWSVLLSQILDLIEQREALQQELTREDDPTPPPLSKLEIDQKAHALKNRIAQDQLWYEAIWDLVNSEDTQSLDELLEGLYIQLTKLERKQELLDKSIKQSAQLVGHVEAQRPILESFRDSMGEALKALERR